MGSLVESEYGRVPQVDDKTSVLFDFDGTIGDTEAPAMEVAFWEIAPYLKDATASNLLEQVPEFVRENAGKAFEFMVEHNDEERKKAGLDSAEEMRKAKKEDQDVVKLVDEHRAQFGLPGLRAVFDTYPSLLQQQKIETVEALSKVAQPCPGIPALLDGLKAAGIAFCISTTSPKPRVPASITACGLDHHFPPPKVHSGESDFDPPRFKPAPDVYLRAAAHEGAHPQNCVAVEDSASGVGSAANANVGLIIGYVGASHITEGARDGHAKMLLSGNRSTSGRGANLVLREASDILPIIERFRKERTTDWLNEKYLQETVKARFWLK